MVGMTHTEANAIPFVSITGEKKAENILPD